MTSSRNRLGYRFALVHPAVLWELGVTVRAPIGPAYRESLGLAVPPDLLDPHRVSSSDFGGELLTQLALGYLRLTY